MLLLLLLPWLLVTSRALEIDDQEVVKAMVQKMREEIREEIREDMRKEMEATKSELESVKMEAAATKTIITSLEASLPSTICQAVRDLPVLTTWSPAYPAPGRRRQ